MRKFILSAILASSALGLVSTQGIAGSYGSSTSYQHAQYGGGWNGGGHREQCYWERKQVRIWDETYHRWTWVWRRVRVCH
jgi:hypothetical protein